MRSMRSSPVGARQCAGISPVGSPVGAMHDQGSRKASIREGKRGRGGRKGYQDRHKTELRGYRALPGQQEQGKDLSRRRPSRQRHHRQRPRHAVIRHRPPPRIPPDLLNRALQKLLPSLRRYRRITKQMTPRVQAKHASPSLTRAVRPRARPRPIRSLPRHMRPHRIVLQVPQKRLKPRPI